MPHQGLPTCIFSPSNTLLDIAFFIVHVLSSLFLVLDHATIPHIYPPLLPFFYLPTTCHAIPPAHTPIWTFALLVRFCACACLSILTRSQPGVLRASCLFPLVLALLMLPPAAPSFSLVYMLISFPRALPVAAKRAFLGGRAALTQNATCAPQHAAPPQPSTTNIRYRSAAAAKHSNGLPATVYFFSRRSTYNTNGLYLVNMTLVMVGTAGPQFFCVHAFCRISMTEHPFRQLPCRDFRHTFITRTNEPNVTLRWVRLRRATPLPFWRLRHFTFLHRGRLLDGWFRYQLLIPYTYYTRGATPVFRCDHVHTIL